MQCRAFVVALAFCSSCWKWFGLPLSIGRSSANPGISSPTFALPLGFGRPCPLSLRSRHYTGHVPAGHQPLILNLMPTSVLRHGVQHSRVLPVTQRRALGELWEAVVQNPATQYILTDPVIRVCGTSFLLFGLLIGTVATATDDAFTPKAYLERSLRTAARRKGRDTKDASKPPTIVCLGDSLTRGNLSADWVGVLRKSLAGRVVLNAGVNMQCVQNVKERLEEVVACRPSHVTVLVGTNDMKARMSTLEGMLYAAFGNLQKVPTIEEYEADLIWIRDRLLSVGACVALVSPPVLGEDSTSPANRRAALYAEAVKRVAEEGGPSCAYLPLFELTSQSLPATGGQAYCGWQFFLWVCGLCIDMHVLRRDLCEVQRERRLAVTCDLVHLGPVAAASLAEMTESFVKKTPGRGMSLPF